MANIILYIYDTFHISQRISLNLFYKSCHWSRKNDLNSETHAHQKDKYTT